MTDQVIKTEDDDSPIIVVKRDKWTRKIDFLLACMGFSVGLGNVWRFPYLCYKNGGGAFLIPYCLGVVFGGIPIFCLEVMIGQFMARGGIEVWNMVPLLKGIGFASLTVLFIVNTYYNIILTWSFYYLFSSFSSPVPWSNCNNTWNTYNCSVTSLVYGTNTSDTTDPTVEFWERKVLGISSGIEEMGTVKLDLVFALLGAWIVVFLCISKGIKTSGKVMYVTATTPYIFMFILLIRAATLKGSNIGLKYYLEPKWSKLLELEVWVDSGTQIFFSYAIALGTLSALGSYNQYRYNCFRDCVLFAGINSGTSFLAGFIIFLTLGFMSESTGVSIDKVAASGPGLAFIVYPKALSEMPLTALWAVLFFLMLILLGLDSQFVGVEGFVTGISDIFPQWMSRSRNKTCFIIGVCLCNFAIGISMVTNGGMYIFQIFDYYGGSRIILIIAVMESLTVSYVYGINKFSKKLKDMLGYSLGYLPHIFWGFISPVYLLSIFIMSAISYSKLDYNRGFGRTRYVYPQWSIYVGWSMACCGMVFIPLVATIKLVRAKGTFIERIKHTLKPIMTKHDNEEELNKNISEEFTKF